MLRVSASGRDGVSTVSPTVSTQPAPSETRLARRGRSSLMRRICASPNRVSSALRTVRLLSSFSACTSISRLVSNTTHKVSARRNTAAGVGAPKGNLTRRSSPPCMISATTAPGAAFAGGFGAATAAAATAGDQRRPGATTAGASAAGPGAGISSRGAAACSDFGAGFSCKGGGDAGAAACSALGAGNGAAAGLAGLGGVRRRLGPVRLPQPWARPPAFQARVSFARLPRARLLSARRIP